MLRQYLVFFFSKHTPRAHVAVLARRTPRFLVLYTQQQHTAPKHDKACFLSRYGCCCCWCVCFRSGVFHDPPRECSLSSARTSRPRDLCLPLRAIAPVLSVPRCLFTPEGEWAGGPPHLPGSAQHQAQELWTVPRRGAFRSCVLVQTYFLQLNMNVFRRPPLLRRLSSARCYFSVEARLVGCFDVPSK